MKLASLRAGGRDGTLIVVRRDSRVWAPASTVAPTLQAALDDWERARPGLEDIQLRLESGSLRGLPVVPHLIASPLPRSYEWLDGSAFLAHVKRARLARKAAIPDDLERVPLMYQGGSGGFLDPHSSLPAGKPEWGLDFEAEVAVILADIPLGAAASQVQEDVRLVCLANDVTLRGLVPEELARGFGFVQSKPATAFSPFAVTPDELGTAWRDGRLQAVIEVEHNGKVVGRCQAGDMHFSFFDLIAHAAATRRLTAGTIIGSGTVANEDETRGVSCLVERRMLEILASGTPQTPYLQPGDRVRIQAHLPDGSTPFGIIDQVVADGFHQEDVP